MMLLLLSLKCWDYRHALSHLSGIMRFVLLVLQNSRLDYFCLGCCYNIETVWLSEQAFSPYFSDLEILKWGYLLGVVGLVKKKEVTPRWNFKAYVAAGRSSLWWTELNWTKPRTDVQRYIYCLLHKVGFFCTVFPHTKICNLVYMSL